MGMLLEEPGGIHCSPRQQLPLRMLLNLMNTFQTQWEGILSRKMQEMIIATKPRMTEVGDWSSSDLSWMSNMSDRCVGVNHGLLPRGSECEPRFEGDKKANECQADERWIAVRFHRAKWVDRTVAQKLKCGNCNGMHLREMNINYTWRMINELQNDSYNPGRGTAGRWWLFTKDYSLIDCGCPNANNKLRNNQEVMKKCFHS